MLTPDDLADLAWYYSEQDGALGVRSPLGTQLDMLREGTLPDSPPVVLSDDAMSVRAFEAAERANRIGKRVAKLTSRARVVLELQYGDLHRLHDLSVSLLAATELAMVVWHKSKSDKRVTAFQSIRGIVLKLGLREEKSETCRAQLASMCNEARADLRRAHAEYEGTR